MADMYVGLNVRNKRITLATGIGSTMGAVFEFSGNSVDYINSNDTGYTGYGIFIDVQSQVTEYIINVPNDKDYIISTLDTAQFGIYTYPPLIFNVNFNANVGGFVDVLSLQCYDGTTASVIDNVITIVDIYDAPIIINATSDVGYSFSNWDISNGGLITSDTTITAYFNFVGFTITYDTNGGTSVTSESGVIILPIPLPETTKTGYTFSAWYYDSEFTTQAYAGDTLTSDVTLYAKWIENTYIYYVAFNANGGTGSMDNQIIDVDTPTALTLNSFVGITGYSFSHWNTISDDSGTSYNNEEIVTNLTTVGESITLYAIWKLTYKWTKIS